MSGPNDQPSFARGTAGAAARRRLGRVAFGLGIFAALTVAIFCWMPKTLFDFDASHYTTIAYDIDRHGTFSNGSFDNVDSTTEQPPPGMFFGPVYPTIVAAAMQIDPRFKRAVECWVTADARKQDGTTQCERYAAPMLVIHAVFLTLGVLAIALAGELIFGSEWMFWAAGTLAAAGVVLESELFSFVMTESVTFGLYGVFSYLCVSAWLSLRRRDCFIAGLALGTLVLNRPSFEVLLPLGVAIFAWVAFRKLCSASFASWRAAAFGLGCLLVVAPWIARNYVSLGKIGLTEEYGAATIIERFAFDDMTPREFMLAFPYCLPGVGEPAVNWIFGEQAMHRFTWYKPDSFFTVGRTLRGDLAREHGSLDAVVGSVIGQELRDAWPRYLLVSIPLAWCGLWAGWVAGFLFVPAFGVAVWRAGRRGEFVFLFYAAPAVAMLALHALLANHYTRYNLALIGPFAVGTAWVLAEVAPERIRRVFLRMTPATAR